MLVFVDESGDPGRKIEKGSSLYFVVAMVTFQENDDAERCDRRIDLLRGELGLPPRFEFHFSDNSKRVRQAFLQAINPYPFFFHTVALDKDPRKLYGPAFDFKDSLYKFTARLTFENASPHLNDATVVIDGSGDRTFRDELAAYLRKRVVDPGGRRIIKKVKVQRSVGNNLLQLADYVASVRGRMLLKRPDARALWKYLAAHAMTAQVWPK